MKREERANGIHTGAADTYRTGGTKDDGATNAFRSDNGLKADSAANAFRSDNGLKADSAANAFRSGGYAPEAIVTKEDVAAPFSAQSVRALLPDDDTIYSLAELFKMFGDPTRAHAGEDPRMPASAGSLRRRDRGSAGHERFGRFAPTAHFARSEAGQGRKAGERGALFARRRPRDADHGVRPHAHQRARLTDPFLPHRRARPKACAARSAKRRDTAPARARRWVCPPDSCQI